MRASAWQTLLKELTAMRTTALVFALIFAGIAGVSHVPGAAAQTGGGWTTLFNGKDISNNQIIS